MYYSAFSASLLRRPAKRAVPIARNIARRHSSADLKGAEPLQCPYPTRKRSLSSGDLIGSALHPQDIKNKEATQGFLNVVRSRSKGLPSGSEDALWKQFGHARDFMKVFSENLSKAKKLEGFKTSTSQSNGEQGPMKEDIKIEKRKEELLQIAKGVLNLGRSKLGDFRKGLIAVARHSKIEDHKQDSWYNQKSHPRTLAPTSCTIEGYLLGPGSRTKRSWATIRLSHLLIYENKATADEHLSPVALVNLDKVQDLIQIDDAGFDLHFVDENETISTLRFWGEDEATATAWTSALRCSDLLKSDCDSNISSL